MSHFLHFGQNHGRNFFRLELLVLVLELNRDDWFASLTLFDFEGPELHVILDSAIGEFAPDQSLSVENGVLGVSGNLALG